MRSCRTRSFAVYSFGKTLHITGWRVGYCVAPPVLTRELRKVHQFNAFSIAAPLQAAIALYLERHPDAWRDVAAFFSAKRDLLLARLAGSGLTLPPARRHLFPARGLFAAAASSPRCTDVEFTERLINEAGVAVIPLSPFYREPPRGMRIVRLCVAKLDETLIEAAARISAYTRAAEQESLSMSFRVSVVQQPLVWQDAAANRAHFAAGAGAARGRRPISSCCRRCSRPASR